MTNRSISRPLPVPSSETAPFWQAAREDRLAFQRCGACDAAVFYPRLVCPVCMSEDLTWQSAIGTGTIHSVTVVERAPGAFRDLVPYAVALVDLDEGFRMMSRVLTEAPDALRIGDRVAIRFEPQNDEIVLPLFAPLGA